MDLLEELRADSNLWFSKIPKDILGIIEPFLYNYKYFSFTDRILEKYSCYSKNNKKIYHGCLISYRYPLDNLDNAERICYYVHGEKHGLETYYNRNGTIFMTINWNRGTMDGEYCVYHANGTLRRRIIYKNNEMDGTEEKFFDDGKINVQSFFKNGRQDGIYTYWDKNGNILSKQMYSNGIFMGNVAF